MIRLKGSMLYGDPMGRLRVRVPRMTGDINGFVQTTGQLNVKLPAHISSATGYLSTEGTLRFGLPAIKSVFTGGPDFKGDLNFNIPKIRFKGSAYINEFGSLSITLPALRMGVARRNDIIGSLNIELPSLAMAFASLSSIEGILNVCLPSLAAAFYAGSSDDAYESMVMNLKNQALTLYTNYNFNSMCQFNGVPLGATKTGIFNLNSGNTDVGMFIDWNIKTGLLDLEQLAKYKLRQAWISYKTNGDLMFTVVLPDGTEYEYPLAGVDEVETGLRVKFGRGIRSKYIALDIENIDGSTFELDELKLHFHKTQKVR